MSLVVAVKTLEGLVLAVDSRLVITPVDEEGVAQAAGTYDNITTNLFSFKPPHNFIGAVSYDQPVLGNRLVSGYFTEFNEYLSKQRPERLSVYDFATELSEFFTTKWDAIPPLGVQLSFLIAGYDDKEATGRVYSVKIPENTEPVELMEGLPFGILPDGEARIVGRIIAGYDITLTDIVNQNLTDKKKLELRLPIPYDLLSLRAAVNLAVVLIRATIDLQNLAIMPHTCGGPIDVCTISNVDGLIYVERKEVTGEY
jgi:20S proteasome alpha/beta subunit